MTSSKLPMNKTLSLSQLVDELYKSIEITPTTFAREYPATEEHWPTSNIVENFFNGFPKEKEDIKITVARVKQYKTSSGEIDIIIKFSKDKEFVEREYTIKGFNKEGRTFEEVVEKLYGNVKIELTNEGEQLTSSKDNWTSQTITSRFFVGLPTSKEGIDVKVDSVLTDEANDSIKISFRFSKDKNSIIKKFTVTGFRKVDPMWNDINEIYGDVIITPTSEAKKLTATEENWPISKITPTFFNGLPMSKHDISVKVKSVMYASANGCLFIQLTYSKGTKSIDRTYLVSDFKV